MYTFPSATINHVTYTAKRWGQFPTITYSTATPSGHAAITAGNEFVLVATDLSNITIYIEDGVSTNTQISAAIAASTATVQSLMAKDLITVAIAGGHGSDTNTGVTATSLSGASSIPAPSEQPARIIPLLSVDPANPQEGDVWYNLTSHLLKFYDGTTVQTVAVV